MLPEAWQELVDAFAAGVYVLLGVIHLDLWRRRREERGRLWLALATAGASAAERTGMALRRAAGGLPPAVERRRSVDRSVNPTARGVVERLRGRVEALA